MSAGVEEYSSSVFSAPTVVIEIGQRVMGLRNPALIVRLLPEWSVALFTVARALGPWEVLCSAGD